MATELRRAPRVVLHRAGEEGLREEEARDPEGGRRLDVVYPLLEEGQPAEHVGHVRAERLARRVGVLHPQRGAVAERERPGEGLELGVHDDEALDGLLERGERRAHDRDEPVEADELLREHRVHALEVGHREECLHSLEVVVARQLTRDVLDNLLEHVGITARGAARARLREHDGVEELARLLQVLGDRRVLVEAEDARRLVRSGSGSDVARARQGRGEGAARAW